MKIEDLIVMEAFDSKWDEDVFYAFTDGHETKSGHKENFLACKALISGYIANIKDAHIKEIKMWVHSNRRFIVRRAAINSKKTFRMDGSDAWCWFASKIKIANLPYHIHEEVIKQQLSSLGLKAFIRKSYNTERIVLEIHEN